MAFIDAPQPVTIRNARRIGSIEATVTIEETGTDDMEITQHPVQRGASITDHAYVKPAQLAVRVAFQATENDTLEGIYRKLLDLQALREPFEVVTGKRIYRDMLFKSIGQTTDPKTDAILSISCAFMQVIIVDVTLTTVPPRAKQRNPGKTGATDKAGAKQAKPVAAAPATSVLSRIAGALK